MIEATAGTARDDSRVAASAAPTVDRRAVAQRRPLVVAVTWLLFTIGLVWFIYAGAVRVGAGQWYGQRLRVRVIWSRFVDFLADKGATAIMVGLVGVAAIATLIGSLLLLWMVLRLRESDPETTEPPDVH